MLLPSHLKVHKGLSRNKKNLDLDQKVSPRMHKLADSQRSNLPAQSYLRFESRLATSSISQQSFERSKICNSSNSFRALNNVSNLINSSQDSFTHVKNLNTVSQKEIQKFHVHEISTTREKSDVREYKSNHRNDENSAVIKTRIPGFHHANDLSNLTNERKQTENDNLDGFTTFRKDSQRESFEISPINSTKSVLAPLQTTITQNQKCNSVSNTTPRNFEKKTDLFSLKKNSFVDSFRQDNRVINNLKNFDRETLKNILFNMVNENKKRDTVLFGLVDQKSSIKDERANLDLKLTQILAQKKKSEDALEQVNHQINCQLRENTFLKKCQARLESILPGPEDRCKDLDSALKKTQENENKLIEKEREGMIIKKAIQEFEKTKGTLTQDEQEKNQTQIKRIELELKVRQREVKQLTSIIEGIKLKTLKEKEAEDKLFSLEKTQDRLITENNKLKNQLSQEQQKIFETNHLNKRIVLKVYQNSEYLDFVKNYLNHILKIAEKGIKRREISDHEIQVFKTLQRNKTHKSYHNSVTQSNVKVFIKKNLISTKDICKEFVTWMNKICEEFARGYENYHFDFVFNRKEL